MLRVATVILILGLAGCFGSEGDDEAGDDEAGAGGTPAALSGRTFVVSALVEDGEPRQIVPDTRIAVAFGAKENGRLAWDAGCNQASADLQITAERLRVKDRFSSTLMGCPGELGEQEDWVTSVLTADPKWRLEGDDLHLSTGVATVELRAVVG